MKIEKRLSEMVKSDFIELTHDAEGKLRGGFGTIAPGNGGIDPQAANNCTCNGNNCTCNGGDNCDCPNFCATEGNNCKCGTTTTAEEGASTTLILF